jgi:hypothetical protein
MTVLFFAVWGRIISIQSWKNFCNVGATGTTGSTGQTVLDSKLEKFFNPTCVVMASYLHKSLLHKDLCQN